MGGRKDIPLIVEDENIEQILLAIPSAKGEVIRDVLSYCELPDVDIKIIPPIGKIYSEEIWRSGPGMCGLRTFSAGQRSRSMTRR